MWDLADLARMVRLLDVEAAYQVVRTYFPDHVEAFLDLKPASPGGRPRSSTAPPLTLS